MIALDPGWLIILPGMAWAIATMYVPILGANLNVTQTWTVTFLIVILVVLSLLCHVLAHQFTARVRRLNRPARIPFHIFGDAAQVWPAAPSTWGEILAALSGLFANLFLAGLTYLIWNAQLNMYLNLSMLFTSLFNVWLAVINLMPAFPLDGGRITRAILQNLFRQSGMATSTGVRLGYVFIVIQIGWGIFLMAKPYQYSLQTGMATIVFAILLCAGLVLHPAWRTGIPERARPRVVHRALRALVAGVVILSMSGVSSILLLTNNGIDAPGFALSVEPMVEIPPQNRYQPAGTFILTSVISQAPIPVGVWLVGKISPAYQVLPPEKRVPNRIPAREEARQNYQMLSQSEILGALVGLRLAGYPVETSGKGAQVVTILPESLAQGLLQPGDVIVGFNGKSIQTTSDLIDQVQAQAPHSTVKLMVNRDQQVREIDVELMASPQPDNPPMLGITVQDAGYDYQLPIPVKIVPHKIIGGPSAGLMFALTVYNMLTPADLTGGRKIAGTGTISLDGKVGPIGGVAQKVAAAEAVGAEYFLSPAENYPDALSVARRIKVIKVTTIEEAIQFLQGLPGK